MPKSVSRILLPAVALALGVSTLACRDAPPKLNVSTEPASSSAHPVVFDPPQGATGVDPSRTTLSVTFDREMDPQGWAWVIEGAMTAPELGESAWDPSMRTNTVQAKLEPGRDYVVWVNSPQYLYFKDRLGVPATPTRWTFSTSGGAASGESTSEVGLLRSTPQGPPRVVQLEPPNGARRERPFPRRRERLRCRRTAGRRCYPCGCDRKRPTWSG